MTSPELTSRDPHLESRAAKHLIDNCVEINFNDPRSPSQIASDLAQAGHIPPLEQTGGKIALEATIKAGTEPGFDPSSVSKEYLINC